MQDLTIQDWDMLISAREDRGDYEESSYYIDRETGEILFFGMETVAAARREEDDPPSIEWLRTDLESYQQIFEEPGRYVVVEPTERHEAWERMSAFASSLADPGLAGRLHRAIAGKGAFRRFRDEVHTAGIQNDWAIYEHRQQVADALAWLNANGINPTNPPAIQTAPTRTEAEKRLDASLRDVQNELEQLVRSFGMREIDEIEAVLLARRLGEKLVEL